ncbi:hypothetical protein NDI33_05735, partial [Trichocoleus sp. DQ-A1]
SCQLCRQFDSRLNCLLPPAQEALPDQRCCLACLTRTHVNITLQGLKTPVNLTFQRPNGALLRVVPQTSGEQGMLEVVLEETTDLSVDKNAMTIQENGNVLLN